MNSVTAQSWIAADKAMAPERGVHVPFTAPLLCGARGRSSTRGIDYILPNPSGGRGTYVAAWRIVSELAAPTLHDMLLARRLHALPALTPAGLRAAARAVAAEGYAGRAAAAAAVRAQSAIEAETLRCWAMLLMALIRGSDIPEREHARALAGLGAAGPGQVTDGFTRLALRLGWEPALLSDGLGQVAAQLVPLAPGGRHRRLLAMLREVRVSLGEEQAQQARQQTRLAAALDRTVRSIGRCVNQAEQLLDRHLAQNDPAALLGRWQADPVAALAPAASLQALLDGWDRICLLWLDATTLSARINILPEIALLVRLAASAGDAAEPPEVVPSRLPDKPDAPQALPPEPAAANPPPALIERNERIRALELALDHDGG